MKNFIEIIKVIVIVCLVIVMAWLFMALHRTATNIEGLTNKLQQTEIVITKMKSELTSVNKSLIDLNNTLDSSWFFKKGGK